MAGAKVVFKKIKGKVIPLKASPSSKDLAAGAAAFAGSGIAAQKARQKTAEKIKGKGKRSFGFIPNVTAEIGLSAAILTVLAKKGPARLQRGIPKFGNVVSGAFGLARKQGQEF